MDYTNDATMLRKVTELMDKLEKNGQMQQLAYENGIDTKNSVRLTAATKENIAVSVIALMLAKQDNDPRYRDLVRYGMDHRQTKAGIINDYKNQANALITKYRNGERPETVEIVKIETESYDGYGDRWLDADIPDIYNEQAYVSWSNRIIQEGVGKVIGTIVLLPLVLVGKAIALVISLIDKFIGLFTRISPQRLLKKLESMPEEKRERFSLTVKADNKDDMKLLRLQSDGYIMLTEAFSAFCDSVESLIENGVDEKRITNEIDKLVAKAEELLTDESIKMPSLGENSGTLTYDETVDLLKDLCRFDMKKCRNVSHRLQRILSRIKTVSKEEQEKNGGLTDSDVTKLQVGVAFITAKLQSWTKMRDRLLKKADITFNGYAAAHHDAYNERKNELENRTMKVATEQYEGYGEELMALDIPYTSELYSESYFESVIQEGAGGAVALGVGGLVVGALALPFIIIGAAIKLIVRLIDSFIGLFTRVSPERLIKKMSKIPLNERDRFSITFKDIELAQLRLTSSGFVSVLELVDTFSTNVSAAIDDNNVDEKLVKMSDDLMDSINKLVSQGGSASIDSTKLTFDEMMDLLKDLAKLNMRDVKARSKQLKVALKKIDTVSMGQKYETGEGITKLEILGIKKVINICVSIVQNWTRSRDEILRKAYKTVQMDGSAKMIKEVEEENRRMQEEQERRNAAALKFYQDDLKRRTEESRRAEKEERKRQAEEEREYEERYQRRLREDAEHQERIDALRKGIDEQREKERARKEREEREERQKRRKQDDEEFDRRMKKENDDFWKKEEEKSRKRDEEWAREKAEREKREKADREKREQEKSEQQKRHEEIEAYIQHDRRVRELNGKLRSTGSKLKTDTQYMAIALKQVELAFDKDARRSRADIDKSGILSSVLEHLDTIVYRSNLVVESINQYRTYVYEFYEKNDSKAREWTDKEIKQLLNFKSVNRAASELLKQAEKTNRMINDYRTSHISGSSVTPNDISDAIDKYRQLQAHFMHYTNNTSVYQDGIDGLVIML